MKRGIVLSHEVRYEEREGGCWKKLVRERAFEADGALCEAYFNLLRKTVVRIPAGTRMVMGAFQDPGDGRWVAHATFYGTPSHRFQTPYCRTLDGAFDILNKLVNGEHIPGLTP